MPRTTSTIFTVALWSLCFCAELQAQNSYDTRAVPLRTPPPEYPQFLRAAKVEGIVSVELRVNENGRVTEALVIETSEPRLNRYALASVRKWTFRPATLDDKAVESVVQVPIAFRLNDK